MSTKMVLPRGLRNNNPGNIRRSVTGYMGEKASSDPAFKQFRTMEWGYRAMFVLLHTYRKRHGLDTPKKMISRWAPPSENHTDGYIGFVGREAGLDPDETVDTLCPGQMIPLVKAMSRVENGTDAVAEEVAGGWKLFVEHQP